MELKLNNSGSIIIVSVLDTAGGGEESSGGYSVQPILIGISTNEN